MIRPYERARTMVDLLDGDIVVDLEHRRKHNRRVGQLLSEEAAGGSARRAETARLQAETARLQHRIKGWLGKHESVEGLAAIPEPAQCESDGRKVPRTRTGSPRAHQSRRGHADTDSDEVPARLRSEATPKGPSWYQVRMRMLQDVAMTQATQCLDSGCNPAACCLRTDGKHATRGLGVEWMEALAVAVWAISTAAFYAI